MADTISDSELTVGDDEVDFPVWYNKFITKHGKLYPAIHKDNNFAGLFDNIGQWWTKSELTLNEFVGLFLIFCNETGGTFKPLVEHGDDAYFFNAIPHKKRSYNTLAGNIKAGDGLVAAGVLDKDADADEVKAWNGEVYPKDSDDDTKKAARECDFYKFRGRGLVQTTGRTNYLATVNPALKAAGKKLATELTDAELTIAVKEPKVYMAMLKKFLTAGSFPKLIAGLNDTKPGFHAVGRHVSGGDAYAKLYEERGVKLLKALNDEGWDD